MAEEELLYTKRPSGPNLKLALHIFLKKNPLVQVITWKQRKEEKNRGQAMLSDVTGHTLI